MRIYLDVCCLNRPFDDQTQNRIHLEAEAILTILKIIESGHWILLNSDGIFYETSKNPDSEKKTKVHFILSKAKEYIKIDKKILTRTKQLQKLTVKSFDALHVSCAENGNADIFLTTDDQLIKKMRQHEDKIKVKVNNPLDWIKEIV